MRTVSTNIASGIAALALVAASTPGFGQTAGQPVGVNTAVRKVVLIRENTSSQARQAVVRERVRVGNAITTRVDAGLQVTLLDQTTFTMGPNAQLTIDKFIYDPSRGSTTAASVARGTFRFLSGSGKRGEERLNTPSASIGIRGTMLEGAVGQDAITMAMLQKLAMGSNVDPATATFVVLRGPGADAPAGVRHGAIDVTSGGKTVTLNKPGMAVFVPHVGAVPIPFQMSSVVYQAFDVVLRTAPSAFSPEIAAFANYAQQQGVNGVVVQWAKASVGTPHTTGPRPNRPGTDYGGWGVAIMTAVGGIIGAVQNGGNHGGNAPPPSGQCNGDQCPISP